MYVIYMCDNEVIVCSADDEARLIREYFTEGGRNLDDYDRLFQSGPPCFTSRLRHEH